MGFRLFIESNLEQLYNFTRDAFPHCTKRLYATHPIEISRVNFTAFRGLNTLLARCEAKNENRHYNCIILFKDIEYFNARQEFGLIEIVDTIGDHHILRKPEISGNDVLIRCSCPDFKFRGLLPDKLDRSLYGRIGRRTEDTHHIVNPTDAPLVCKHVWKFVEVLQNSRILTD